MFHCKAGCCERAVVFKKEISIHIIELPRVRTRVIVAVGTNSDDHVFVPEAARRASRIEGPGNMVVMKAPISRLFECPLTHNARREACDFKLEPITMPLIKSEDLWATSGTHVMDAPQSDDGTLTGCLHC